MRILEHSQETGQAFTVFGCMARIVHPIFESVGSCPDAIQTKQDFHAFIDYLKFWSRNEKWGMGVTLI